MDSVGDTQRIDSRLRWIVLIILSVAVFFISFMIQALNVALPTIGREFSANATLLGWIVTAYILALAAFSVPFGRIADIFGLKKIIIIGVFVYGVASIFAAISTSAIMLIVFRTIQGISAAMILVNMIALISIIFPQEERGKALGINVTGVYIGSSLGPFLGGVLTGYCGWRSIFILNIPISILVGVFLLWKLKGKWGGHRKQKIDVVGWLIYGPSLIVWMFGFTLLPRSIGFLLAILGIVGIVLFFKWENKTDHPLVNVNIFKNNKLFIFSILAAFFNYTSIFALAFLLSLYLQYIKAYTPELTGLIMITHPVVQAVFSPVGGRVSDKIEPRLVASAGMVLTFIGLFSFIFLTNSTPLWHIIAALAIIGIGFAFFLAPNTNAVMSSVETRNYGVASASMSTMISLGQMMSMGITMVVMAIVVGNVTITPERFSSFMIATKIGFVIFSVLAFCGILTSYFRGKSQ